MLENYLETTSETELRKALEKAAIAQKIWEETPLNDRIEKLKPIKDYLMNNKDKIALKIAIDTGKSLIDAMTTEVIPCIMAITFYMKRAKKFLKPKRIFPVNILFGNKFSQIRRVPYGVVGIFSPWNYPLAIPFSEVIMALISGNAVLLKPAHETPNVAKLFTEIMGKANIPEHLFFNIDTDPAEASSFLLRNGIDKFFFTGSTEIGKHIMKEAGQNLVPVCLELGGKDCMIILKDADLDKAAAGAAWAGFQNCGQSCGGVERIYADYSIYHMFLQKLAEQTIKLRVGSKQSLERDIGEMTTKKQVEHVKDQIKDALKNGAKIYAQSKNPEPENEMIIPPKILTSVTHHMKIMQEKTFGPIVCVMPFKTEEEAIELANDSQYGLTASIWSGSIFYASELAQQIKAGTITINDHLVSHGLPQIPWGGFKKSSIGRTHGKLGFDEMTQPQTIVNDISFFSKKNIFWYPYSRSLYEGLKGAANFLYSPKIFKRIIGCFKVLRVLPRIFQK